MKRNAPLSLVIKASLKLQKMARCSRSETNGNRETVARQAAIGKNWSIQFSENNHGHNERLVDTKETESNL